LSLPEILLGSEEASDVEFVCTFGSPIFDNKLLNGSIDISR